MCGKEPPIICPGKISSGLNIPICNKFQESSKKPGMFSGDGWNGSRDKKHGWPTSSFNKEWANPRGQKLSFIIIFKPTPLCPLISKSPSFNLGTETNRQPERYLNKLLQTQAPKQWIKPTSSNLVNSRLNSTRIRGPGKS